MRRCWRKAASTPGSTACRWWVDVRLCRPRPRPEALMPPSSCARAGSRHESRFPRIIRVAPPHALQYFREDRAARLADEVGTIYKQAGLPFALCYPSPYHVGILAGLPDHLPRPPPARLVRGARLPARRRVAAWRPAPRCSPTSVDAPWASSRWWPSRGLRAGAGSVCAMPGPAGLPVLAEERSDEQPLVVMGGPLTFSNPLPLAPFADVLLLGESEETDSPTCWRPGAGGLAARRAARPLAREPGFTSRHGDRAGRWPAADDRLPALRRSSRPTPSCRTCSSSSPSAAAHAAAPTA